MRDWQRYSWCEREEGMQRVNDRFVESLTDRVQ